MSFMQEQLDIDQPVTLEWFLTASSEIQCQVINTLDIETLLVWRQTNRLFRLIAEDCVTQLQSNKERGRVVTVDFLLLFPRLTSLINVYVRIRNRQDLEIFQRFLSRTNPIGRRINFVYPGLILSPESEISVSPDELRWYTDFSRTNNIIVTVANTQDFEALESIQWTPNRILFLESYDGNIYEAIPNYITSRCASLPDDFVFFVENQRTRFGYELLATLGDVVWYSGPGIGLNIRRLRDCLNTKYANVSYYGTTYSPGSPLRDVGVPISRNDLQEVVLLSPRIREFLTVAYGDTGYVPKLTMRSTDLRNILQGYFRERGLVTETEDFIVDELFYTYFGPMIETRRLFSEFVTPEGRVLTISKGALQRTMTSEVFPGPDVPLSFGNLLLLTNPTS
jgi:hypothetical protein